MNINNKSLDGWMGAGQVRQRDTTLFSKPLKRIQNKNDAGIVITDKTCLIMDEVDGMSAGDRGGVGALNALIKKSKVFASRTAPCCD